jgi:hypothetical protein
MLCCVDLVRTDVFEERVTSIIRVTRIDALRTLAIKLKNAAKKYYVRREVLVWNTRLRMEGRVVEADSDIGLLNGQTTKQDSIALRLGGRVVYIKHHGLRIGDCITKWTWVMSQSIYVANNRLHGLLRLKPSSLLIL